MFRAYHGTNASFANFDPAMMGSLEDRSSNGRLGVWVAYDHCLAAKFGDTLLDLDIRIVPERARDLHIDELLKMHRQASRAKHDIEKTKCCQPLPAMARAGTR